MSIVNSVGLLRQFYQNHPSFAGRRASKVSTGETATQSIKDEIGKLQNVRDSLQPARTRHLGGIANAENRLRASLGRQATMKVAQADRAMPTSFRGALDQATRRMRARQGIVNRGDAAIRNQSLRDRIAVARQQESRRGSLQNTLQQAVNIREGVNVGLSNANARIRSAKANMYGTLAGAGVRAFGSWWNNRTPGVTTQSMDQGTAAADFMNMNPPPNYTDPMQPLPPVYG